MEEMNFAKQMMDFYKTGFNNTFDTLVMLHELADKAILATMDQATWLPEQGKKPVKDWIQVTKKNREEFKKAADANFKKVEDLFGNSVSSFNPLSATAQKAAPTSGK